MNRKLTALEETFVKEAWAGHFTVHYLADGRPYALGACRTGNLFSMEVTESFDQCSETSVYLLRESGGSA